VNWQLLLLQLGLSTLGSTRQSLLHAPQCCTFVRLSISQPVLAIPSQSPNALLLQVVMLQVRLPTAPVHAVTAFAAAQLRPQEPQFWAVLSGVSQLVSSPLQSSQSGAHWPTRQAPVAQVAVALAIAQPSSQPPQSLSVVSEVSQPSR
jgi:hypothetical protein